MFKISCVNYLNAIPFIKGIEQSDYLKKNASLSLDFPRICAKKIISNEVDIALVPVATIHYLKQYEIVSTHCIAAGKKVKTVCLFSEKPIEEITHILLDFQSLTSVTLVQVLCKEVWKINPVFIPANAGFEADIQGSTAGVVIGDRCFYLENKFSYVTDLAETWFNYTGKKFVFAVWLSSGRKNITDEFKIEFTKALKTGIDTRFDNLKNYNSLNLSNQTIQEYFRDYIEYELNNQNKESINLFLEKSKNIKIQL